MVQLVDAVDQLAHNMADSLSRSLAESLIKDDDSKAVENDAPDIHEQTTLMANALKHHCALEVCMHIPTVGRKERQTKETNHSTP